MGALDRPLVVDLPLRGEWTVLQTPAHRIPSHGTDLFGQRYAYDLTRTDDRRGGGHVHPASTLRWLLVGGRTRRCYAWGQPVHAALGGEVVVAVDDVPERRWIHVVREAWQALRNARAYATGRTPLDVRRLAGNHVIIRTTDDGRDAYAVYAHLAPGSVTVDTGQHVAVGDVVGRVGHTGNSTAPHLHFHVMDRADPTDARGIPCAFAHYLVRHDGAWTGVHAGIPGRHERIRSPGPPDT
ncbi:MAG TPA: M23 family metallopeptidase [Acidimicrobiales bacterium]